MYNGNLHHSSRRSRKPQRGTSTRHSTGPPRGVLLDITQVRGREWLEAGRRVSGGSEGAEATQGVRVEEGDPLLLRLGWCKRRKEAKRQTHRVGQAYTQPPSRGYISGTSIIVADASHDVKPSGNPTIGSPIHKVGISRWDCGSSTPPITKTSWTCAGG